MPAPNPFTPPEIVILSALVALVQPAFDATPRLYGPKMTVMDRSIDSVDDVVLPICRFFNPEQNLIRLASTVRSTDWAGRQPDSFAFRLEYPPSSTIRPVTLAQLETQVMHDKWLVVNQITALEHMKLPQPGLPDGIVAEMAKELHIRSNIGQFAADATNVVLLVEGRFTVRLKLLGSSVASAQ